MLNKNKWFVVKERWNENLQDKLQLMVVDFLFVSFYFFGFEFQVDVCYRNKYLAGKI